MGKHVTEEKNIPFRVIDWLLVLLSAVILLGAIGFYRYSKREIDRRYDVICVFLISGIERDDWEVFGGEWFRTGDPLRSSNGTVILGYLESAEEKPHWKPTVQEGEAVWSEHPFLTDLEVAVRMTVTYREGDGLRAGDLRIAAGERGDFRFGTLLTGAEIVEVREVELA